MRSDDYDQLVQTIYAGAYDDTAFRHALLTLAALHRCGSAALVYTDRTLPGTDVALTYGPFSDPAVRARYELYAADDPAPRAMARLAIGEAAATNRLFTPEFLATSRFLHEFYRPLGFEEALGGPVASADGRMGIVAIHRGSDRAPFDSDEIAGFGRLLPHFGQALALRRKFFDLMEHDSALGAALEVTAQGVLIVDLHGQLKHANARARAILGRRDGFILSRTGHLRLRDSESDRRLTALVAQPITAQQRPVFQVRRGFGSRPYLIRISGSGMAMSQQTDSMTILYVSDPEAHISWNAAAIAEMLRISPQAAGLVTTLMQGGDLATHAAAVGISRNTAKFHLRSAFNATGTSRQADLIRVVEGILRDLGD